MSTLVSVEEKVFLEDGAAKDVRADGRGRAQYREIALETGIISHANGSVRVKLDSTEVLIGVKLEIGVTDPQQPSQGRIECVVDWYVVAMPNFMLLIIIFLVLRSRRHGILKMTPKKSIVAWRTKLSASCEMDIHLI